MQKIELNLISDIGKIALIQALENFLDKTIEEYGDNSITYKATTHIYKQVKKEFLNDFNFKY